MAGSERSGFSNSSDHLLENAYYILTPGGQVSLNKLTAFSELVDSPGSHSHGPYCWGAWFYHSGSQSPSHIIASSLVNLVSALDNDAEYMKTIAAGGFRDITRIASSSPVMWQQIWPGKHQKYFQLFWTNIFACWSRSAALLTTKMRTSFISFLPPPEITVILLT